MRSLIGFLVAASLAGMLACSSSLDHGTTERQIAEAIQSRTGLSGVSIRCPAVPGLEPGRSVECTASTPDLTGTVPVSVSIGRDGSHRWVMEEAIFSTQAVEPQIKSSEKVIDVFGMGAESVECDRFAKRVVDYRFACRVRLENGSVRSVVAKVVDAEAPVIEWQLG